jgi:hypothetical protein
VVSHEWVNVIESVFNFHKGMMGITSFYDTFLRFLRQFFADLGMNESFSERYIAALESDQRVGHIQCRLLFNELLYQCGAMI